MVNQESGKLLVQCLDHHTNEQAGWVFCFWTQSMLTKLKSANVRVSFKAVRLPHACPPCLLSRIAVETSNGQHFVTRLLQSHCYVAASVTSFWQVHENLVSMSTATLNKFHHACRLQGKTSMLPLQRRNV